jgi:sorting nexin-25
MELSRRDVILAAIAAFVAWGYLTHWLPSLRFLPYAVFAGVILTVLASLWAILFHSKGTEHDDLSAHYGPNHAAFVKPNAWQAEVAAWRTRSAYQPKPVYPPSLLVSHSVDKLLGLVLRDFVVSWYGQISTRPAFKNEVDKVVRIAMGNIVDRLMELDVIGLAVSRIVPVLTTHMHEFYEAERIVRGKKLSRNVTESEDLDLAIAGKFRNGNLHKAASLAFSDSGMAQQHYLRGVLIRLLPKVLPSNALTSSGVTVLIKEIVSCAVLAPSMRLLADPDTWHQMLENYGRTVLQERKNVRKLRAALEEYSPTVANTIKSTPFPKLQPQDNERKFEKFIRAIRQCNTLSDARRFRSEIAIQLRKEQGIEDQDQLYLRRLETGKRMLDRRIAELGAAGSTKVPPKKKRTPLTVETTNKGRSRYETATLRDILYDSSGLSYFMEYMDRQHLMRLVQFWIVVDGFRNPLEDDNEDGHDYVGSAQTWTLSDRNDIAQINDGYLSKPEIKVAPFSREDVKAFLRAGKTATDAQYHAARKAVLRTQTAAYEEMLDPYFHNFKRSDMWYKFLATTEDTIHSPISTGSHHNSHDEQVNPVPSRPKVPRTVTVIGPNKSTDLRRAITSSVDLKARRQSEDGSVRRSFDSSHSASRQPLFDDDVDSENMARSTASFDSDQETNGAAGDDPKIVDAMQAALNDIMEERQDGDALFSDSVQNDSLHGSIEFSRPLSGSLSSKKDKDKDKEKPSIASLGLVQGPSRRGVFEDDLFGEETKFPEDDKDDESDSKNDEDVIHEAAPGDLGLAEAIDALTLDIEKLVTQESIVDSLTKKAELTNNAAELRILKKSKSSLQREISRKELQRQQYIIQESDNSLFGRASIAIKSIMVGTEQDGREFAMCKSRYAAYLTSN